MTHEVCLEINNPNKEKRNRKTLGYLANYADDTRFSSMRQRKMPGYIYTQKTVAQMMIVITE